MLAQCDKCDAQFDSHDGGTVINGKTYCPDCEPKPGWTVKEIAKVILAGVLILAGMILLVVVEIHFLS